MRLILIVLAILCLLNPAVGQGEEEEEEDYIEEENPEAHERCVRRVMDLVFLMDESSSIPPRSFSLEKKLIQNVIKLLDIGEAATRVGLITFSSQARTQFTLDRWYSRSDMIKAVSYVRQMGGDTATGDGLKLLRDITFTSDKGARMNDVAVPKVIIVITDGNSQRHDLTVMEAMKTKIAGITIFSVAVGEKINHHEVEEIASNVDHVVEKIEVNTAVAACEATPPPQAATLKECEGVAVDVIFVIDTSNSIMDHQFEKMIDFMAKLVMHFDISEDAIHVAVITFANRPKAQIELRDYMEKIPLAKAIYAVHRQYGGSYTFCAIDLVLEHGLLEEYGARKEAAKVGVVVTDGSSADPVRTELRAAEARQAGIRMIAVGIGDKIDQEELKTIAGDERMVFVIDDFESLHENIIPLAEATCKNVPPAPRATEPPIEINRACLSSEADVMFLIDSSDQVSNTEYSQMKKFLEYVAMTVNVASGRSKMGVIQYGRQGDIVIDLNKFTDRDALKSRIKRLRRTRGYRNTGNALKVLRKRAFIASNRNGPKIGVIITTGESEDITVSAQEANMARRAGIILYVIGIRQQKSGDEMVAIATDENRMYVPRSTADLRNMADTLVTRLCGEKPLTPSQPLIDRGPCKGKAADVGFILDNSGSVRPHQYVKMMEFVENLVLSLDVSRDLVRITVVTFANDARIQLNLDEMFNGADIVEKLMSMKRQVGGTNTGDALRLFREQAISMNGARDNVPKIGVLVTDGKSKDSSVSIEEASAVRASGITLFVVGVGSNLDRRELEGMVGRENIRKNLFLAPDFGALVDLSDRIAKLTCEVPPPKEIVAQVRPECRGKPVDVVFLLDNSDDIRPTQYIQMMDFLENIVLSLDVASDRTRVGVATVADRALKRFDLNRYRGALDVVDAMNNFRRQTGRSVDIGSGIRIISDDMLRGSNGARTGVPKVVVVLTSGRSRDTQRTIREATSLREKGAIVLAIGVGQRLDQDELKGIVGREHTERIHMTGSFATLTTLLDRVVQATCEATPPTEPPKTTIGCEGKPLDVVFILDNSGSIRPRQYIKMMEFVQTLVLSFDVGEAATHVATVTFADKAEVRFRLNQFYDSLVIVDEMMSFKRQSGGTNTGEALQFARERVFTTASGARPGVLKVGIVITDGKSKSKPDTLRQAAKLRSFGYVLYAVGVGSDIDEEELQGIAGMQYPDRYIGARSFDALVDLNDQIIKGTCDSTPPPPRPEVTDACTGKPADVLFVLDNSGSISNINYGKMMTFVEDLTLSFDIGQDKTRIGLISFADDAKLRLRLGQLFDGLDIVAEMMALRRQTGRTDTAGALKLAREEGFKTENGGRDKLLKVVIVITDGKSNETPMTLEEAAKLRDMGVVVFAIGVGRNLDTAELRGIAGDKFAADRFYESESFDALVDLSVKIMKITCEAQPPAPKNEACVGKPADVVLVLDNSGSIRPNQYTKMMEFVETLVLSFDVGQANTRIGLITFANDAMHRFDLKDYDDALDVVDAMMTMRRQRGGTNTADALQMLRERSFQEQYGARPGILKVGIVITDGKSRDTDATLRQAALSRSLGYILYAVGVGRNLDVDELQGIAGLQYPDRFYSAESFDALVDLNDKIIQTTCDATVAPTRPPLREACKGKPIDLIFALDNSGSVSNINYGKMMTFVEDLVLSLDVSPEATHVGVVSFASDAVVRFRLNKFTDSMDIVAEMMAMKRQTGGTNTGDALKLVREDLYSTQNGARSGILKVTIVITDGKSRDTAATLDQAQQLRASGAVVFAVGVGTNLDMEELKGIAGTQYPDRMYAKETFDALVDLNDKLVQTTCTATPAPLKLESCVGKPADVVLVLDNSGSIRPNQYTKMMEFVETLVLSFDVGQANTRIGLITFANDAMHRFDLKDYDDALDVVDAMMTMQRQRGGTNTADALRMLRERSFQEQYGARPGILKVGIVITDGKSRDTDATLRQAALSRSLGYILYAVGVGRNLDVDELQGIAGLQYPDRFYSAESFDALVDLNDKIIQTTCDATAAPTRPPLLEQCVGKPVDLLFVLDNSGSVSNINYGKMMTFVEDLVLSLDVSADATHVAVISFANDAMVRFRFNKFTDSMDVVAEMMAMRRQSGGTNTADALKLAREDLYTAANGAREGVLRVTIVITDGKSRDTAATLQQASQLREAGAVIFAVGVGTNLDMEELKGIAGTQFPDRMYAKETFDALVDLNDKLVETTCTATPAPVASGIPMCRDKVVDIALIVDRSTDLSSSDFKFSIDEFTKFVSNFDVSLSKTRFAIVSATGEVPVVHSKLDSSTSFGAVKAVLDSLTQVDGINMVAEAMKVVRETVMTADNGARPGALRVVLVFLNKKVADSERSRLVDEGSLMRAAGDTKVFSLAWVGNADFYEAMDIAGEEFYERIIEMNSLTKYQENLDKITEKICTNTFQAAYYLEGGRHMKALKNDLGCPQHPREVDFLLHVSSRSSARHRSLVAEAAERIMTSVQANAMTNTSYGLITFAGRAKVYYRATNRRTVLHALNVLEPAKGRGRVSRALEKLCDAQGTFQTKTSRVGIIITDKIKKWDIVKALKVLPVCRRQNVKLYAVGIGSRISTSVLGKFSDGEEHVYRSDYEQILSDIIKRDCGVN